jgi:hypothetical protein
MTPFWPPRAPTDVVDRCFPQTVERPRSRARVKAQPPGLRPRAGAAPAPPSGRGNLAIPLAAFAIPLAAFAVTLWLLRQRWDGVGR